MSHAPDASLQWLAVFGEMAAFSKRVFARVGQRPHAHQEKVNWKTFDCAQCNEWQKRFDAAFRYELDKFKKHKNQK
jgi:hypothetical protein